MNKVSVFGGLGNQMFQYALSESLNYRGKKTTISFSNFLYRNHHNGFNLYTAFHLNLPWQAKFLNFFLIYGKILYKNKIASFLLKNMVDRYHKQRYSIYREKIEFEFDPAVFDQHDSYLIGVWQVESYFANIEELLRKEFAFRKPNDYQNKLLLYEIDNSNSVSIHIRRGDYLNDTWRKTHAVIQDITYYVNAIELIDKKVENPHYYIFSDDVVWAKENLKLSNCTYIVHNTGSNSYIDMYLMSRCKHNVIANSTFSWWAAWLNKYEMKMVLMPDRWLNNKSCPGIFPKNWQKISILD